MAIKLIASDMDGTLLNSQSIISSQNIAAIKAANQAGIQFVVATGRGLSEVEPLVRQLTIKPDFITLNGALVYNQQKEPVVKIPLNTQNVEQALSLVKNSELYFEIITDRGIYSISRIQKIQHTAHLLKKLNPSLLYKKAVALATSRGELMNVNYVKSFDKVLSDPTINVMKILVFSDKQPEILQQLQHKLNKNPNLIVTSSSPNNIEINNQQAQKGIALIKFANELGLKMDQVMAIGDNLNDESMIKAAGIGVAMANAIEPIKELAQYQTSSNNDNGVAQAIYHAIELNQAQSE
ncbi:Cof-type HAD-IIB family hydrolase [Bombilactobacillus folatiphilus]|uniref:Cof-type HAD-IIB family hydrolase n=1 Tax=Bombilactobacillus folatiphilus TaxID=2923362 RepID=A0ABY4P7T6_9LACO|nr:Cof-type HAD-IIB family hydrolase [Bombilactobacillus folatiphilus]UQS81656.1 Cof-type HAD-IIB family hydrolase [Bombilactobacillus folatiphilus]